MTTDTARDTMAANAAETDDVVWQVANPYRQRVAQLLDDPTERDPDLWEHAFESLGIDHGWAVFTHHELIAEYEPAERDLTWQMARAAVEAAARRQADLELYMRQLLTVSEAHAGKVDRLATADVKAMGKTGIGKERITEAFDKRKAERAG